MLSGLSVVIKEVCPLCLSATVKEVWPLIFSPGPGGVASVFANLREEHVPSVPVSPCVQGIAIPVKTWPLNISSSKGGVASVPGRPNEGGVYSELTQSQERKYSFCASES